MEYSVRGRTIYPGYEVPVFIESSASLGPCPDIFRAVLVTSGSAFAEIDGHKIFIEAPGVLCLNGTERVDLPRSNSFACRPVYFRSEVVNIHLMRDTVLNPPDTNPLAVYRQDLYWLDPFVEKSLSDRFVKLGPLSFAHVSGLLDSLAKSLDEQIDGYWPCRSRSFFLEFLFYVRNIAGKYADCRSGISGGSDRFEDILLYLHTNYQNDISLPLLCEKFAINRTSLNELFQRQTGEPIIRYLICLRIKFACLLLRDTTIPVKELVSRTGFNDMINFNRTFKKHTSYTPMKYRQEFCFMITG